MDKFSKKVGPLRTIMRLIQKAPCSGKRFQTHTGSRINMDNQKKLRPQCLRYLSDRNLPDTWNVSIFKQRMIRCSEMIARECFLRLNATTYQRRNIARTWLCSQMTEFRHHYNIPIYSRLRQAVLFQSLIKNIGRHSPSVVGQAEYTYGIGPESCAQCVNAENSTWFNILNEKASLLLEKRGAPGKKSIFNDHYLVARFGKFEKQPTTFR